MAAGDDHVNLTRARFESPSCEWYLSAVGLHAPRRADAESTPGEQCTIQNANGVSVHLLSTRHIKLIAEIMFLVCSSNKSSCWQAQALNCFE